MPNVTSVWDFSPGETLTAAKLDDVNCGIHVFSGTATRDAAYGGSGERALSEGEFAYLADTNTTQYYDGAAWQTLVTGGMTLISSTTLTGASISLTSIPQTYKDLQIIIRNFRPAADSATLKMRFNSDSTANRHANTPNNSVTGGSFDSTTVTVCQDQDDTTAQGLSYVLIPDYTNTATWKMSMARSLQNNFTTATTYNFSVWTGFYNQTSAVTSLDFLSSSGNLTSGTVLLYGVS